MLVEEASDRMVLPCTERVPVLVVEADVKSVIVVAARVLVPVTEN